MARSIVSISQFTNQLARCLSIGVQYGNKSRLVMNPTLPYSSIRQCWYSPTVAATISTTTTTTLQLFRPIFPTTQRILNNNISLYQQQQKQNIFSLQQLHRNFSSPHEQMSSVSTSPTTTTEANMVMVDDEPFPNIPISEMSNEELADTSTIHGWDLIHSPPKKLPRGALIGTVISDKMNKTINVAVVRYRMVPKVRKRIRYTRKFMAHDENEVANMGDVVMITPCHRISKNKHFMLREIVRPKGQI